MTTLRGKSLTWCTIGRETGQTDLVSTTTTARGDRAQRRADILTAAAEILAESGWAGLSMREVARRAGVSVGATYQWFSGKDEIFAELYIARLEGGLVQLSDAAAEMDLETLIQAMFNWHRPLWRELGRWGLDYVEAIAENPDSDHAVRFRATYYELINSALAAMRRAAAISEVTLTDSPHLGRIVWATANSVAQQAEAMYPEPETADDFVAFAARTLADGVSKAA